MAITTISPGGDALRDLREEYGLTQDQLAESTGVNQGYISLIERGKRPLTANVAWRVTSKLDVDPVRLLKYVETGGYPQPVAA